MFFGLAALNSNPLERSFSSWTLLFGVETCLPTARSYDITAFCIMTSAAAWLYVLGFGALHEQLHHE